MLQDPVFEGAEGGAGVDAEASMDPLRHSATAEAKSLAAQGHLGGDQTADSGSVAVTLGAHCSPRHSNHLASYYRGMLPGMSCYTALFGRISCELPQTPLH